MDTITLENRHPMNGLYSDRSHNEYDVDVNSLTLRAVSTKCPVNFPILEIRYRKSIGSSQEWQDSYSRVDKYLCIAKNIKVSTSHK